MACCIAIALVIGLVRTAWFKLFPSRAPVQLAFAPPARRAAPGGALRAQTDGTPFPASVAAAAAPTRVRGTSWARGLVALGFALGAYAAAMALLSGAGLVESSRPVGMWLALAAAFAAPATAALAVPGRAPALPTGLIVAGLAWLAAGELDAHLLHAVEHSDVLHLPGPIAIVIGLALRSGLTPARLVPRPASSVRSGAIH